MNHLVPDLSGTLPFVVAVLAVALVGGLTSLGVIGRAAYGFVVDNHRTRVARHETIPAYYRRLLLSH